MPDLDTGGGADFTWANGGGSGIFNTHSPFITRLYAYSCSRLSEN